MSMQDQLMVKEEESPTHVDGTRLIDYLAAAEALYYFLALQL